MNNNLAKSLMIKSLRIGWPAGCAQAISEGCPKDVAESQLFEDICPSFDALPNVLSAIRAEDWAAVCAFGTHHNVPRLTARIMRRRNVERSAVWAEARRLGVRVSPRVMECFLNWRECCEQICNPGRSAVDRLARRGWVPLPVFDRHCGGDCDSIFSGTRLNHSRLAAEIQQRGIEAVRGGFFNEWIQVADIRAEEDSLLSACGQREEL